MTSAASLRPSQRAHGRPLKEDSLKMTQFLKLWMHLFLPLILLGKLRDKIGKEILIYVSNSPAGYVGVTYSMTARRHAPPAKRVGRIMRDF